MIHEIAHQWFYGIISNDPYNDAWLDEGFAVFAASLFKFSKLKQAKDYNSMFKPDPNLELPVNLPLNQYESNMSSYVYGKSARKLWELFKDNGELTEAEKFLKSYYHFYKYKQSIKDANVRKGDTVVVYGAGPIGLFAVLGAKIARASNIIVVDLLDSRLNKATEVGATHVLNAKEVNPVEEIRKLFPYGADVVIEAAGVESTFNQDIQSTKVRGTTMVISFHKQVIQFNVPAALLFSGVKLMGSIGYSNETYNEVIESLANGKLSAQSIITSEIDIDNIAEQGFEALIHDKSKAKILVKLSGAH